MKYLIVITALLIGSSVGAQDFDRYFAVSLDYNEPLTNSNWIGESSFPGVRITYRKMINDKFAAGIDLTWATYNQYEPTRTAVFDGGNSAFTTDFFKYIYSYGFMASGQYFLPTGGSKLMPFVGLGLGAALNRYVVYYNIYTDPDESWGFLAKPEVGVLIPFGGKIGITGTVHYDLSTAGSDYFEYSGFNHWGASLGIVFMSY